MPLPRTIFDEPLIQDVKSRVEGFYRSVQDQPIIVPMEQTQIPFFQALEATPSFVQNVLNIPSNIAESAVAKTRFKEFAPLVGLVARFAMPNISGKIYYRGLKNLPKGKGSTQMVGTYLTDKFSEAKFYGKNIQKVRVYPQKPLYSETLPDAAKKLGLWNREFEVLLAKNSRAADNLVSKEALRHGYDSIIRRNGDWIIVLKHSIMHTIK